jgi:hypothetical protein
MIPLSGLNYELQGDLNRLIRGFEDAGLTGIELSLYPFNNEITLTGSHGTFQCGDVDTYESFVIVDGVNFLHKVTATPMGNGLGILLRELIRFDRHGLFTI